MVRRHVAAAIDERASSSTTGGHALDRSGSVRMVATRRSLMRFTSFAQASAAIVGDNQLAVRGVA
jgi:hypothetical protein